MPPLETKHETVASRSLNWTSLLSGVNTLTSTTTFKKPVSRSRLQLQRVARHDTPDRQGQGGRRKKSWKLERCFRPPKAEDKWAMHGRHTGRSCRMRGARAAISNPTSTTPSTGILSSRREEWNQMASEGRGAVTQAIRFSPLLGNHQAERSRHLPQQHSGKRESIRCSSRHCCEVLLKYAFQMLRALSNIINRAENGMRPCIEKPPVDHRCCGVHKKWFWCSESLRTLIRGGG